MILGAALLASPSAGCDCDRCQDRAGEYVVSFAEYDGTCGPLDKIVVTAGKLDPSCTGSAVASEDNCTVNVNVTCQVGENLMEEDAGKVTWDCDAERAEGTISVRLFRTDDQVTECQSTYDVRYEKL
jgi:hypothetical protein